MISGGEADLIEGVEIDQEELQLNEMEIKNLGLEMLTEMGRNLENSKIVSNVTETDQENLNKGESAKIMRNSKNQSTINNKLQSKKRVEHLEFLDFTLTSQMKIYM